MTLVTAPFEPIVVASTAGMPLQEWLALRRKGIGGSDAGAVAGLNPWTPPAKVWGQKTGRTPDDEDNESMFWGRELEAIIGGVFGRRHPELDVWADRTMYRHPEHQWMLANLDLRVGDDGLVEVKTADKDMRDEWADGPPAHYQLQVQHYMAVMGLAYCWVVVLIGGNRYREYLIERDDTLIETLIRIEERFWYVYVEGDMPPPAIGTDAEREWIRETWPGEQGLRVLLSPPALAFLDELRSVKADLARLRAEQTRLEDEIKFEMGDATEGFDPRYPDPVVTWRPHTVRELDRENFKFRSPYLYSTYEVESPRRPFSVKTIKEKK